MRSTIRHLVSACLLVVLSACGSSSYQAANGTDDLDPGNPGKVSPVPPTAPPNTELNICSRLEFQTIEWPSSLNVEAKRAFALALNITGSYEGSSGWKSITNSFDGQGLSLGVLNQCLGQGTLQPLLADMRDNESAYLSSVLNPADHSSLLSMLSKWKSRALMNVAVFDDGNYEKYLPDGRLSQLDELPDGSDGVAQPDAYQAASVAWAKRTLYTDGGTTFIPRWKSALQKIAAHPTYVSYQIDAANDYHKQSVSYMHRLGLKELRSYLMMFDLIVQLGGLYDNNINTYLKTYPLSANVDETIRLRKILSLRLAKVSPKYKTDVVSRKLTIINGTGAVHGTARNLPKEYCYSGSEALSL